MEIDRRDTVFSCIPFRVEEIHFVQKPGTDVPQRPYYRLDCPDWVNILPITEDGRALLIRQRRVGSDSVVLETPGGCVDAGERDTMLAAARELEEETGYATQRILGLGAINPNPAIMTNRVHFFLGLGCAPVADRRNFPDPEERIENVLVPVGDLDNLVRCGEMNHALSALCVMLAQRYLPGLRT